MDHSGRAVTSHEPLSRRSIHPAGPTMQVYGRRHSSAPANDLADRRRVLQSPFGPERVKTAGNLQRRVLANIAFEAFAVVSNQLDDAHGPVLGQTKLLTVIAFRPNEAL